jgi:ornithine cyclodeaminase/alanine dehydrogenase-like protein (mu-crystallin family)
MPGPTLADGLAVPAVGPRSFEVLRTRVDKLVTVSEKDISVALLRLVELEKLIQEGAGAAGIAAVLAGKLPELKGKNVAVLLCGGNIDTSTLGNVLERGLVNDERLIRFSCVVPDRPGGIAGLCATIAFVGASIKQINHERAWLQDDSHSVQVTVTCELTGPQMADHLYEALAEKYPVDFTRPKSEFSGERAAALNRNGQSPAAPPAPAATAKAGQLPAPVLYDYDTIVNNVKPSRALVEAVEDAFAQLANGKVDVPMPMHIGVAETAAAGPGDCHIKGGYIEGAPTWTVKLANVSFYKNVEKGLPAGSGVFVVCDAANGGPKAILHENRYLTDLRTGAAGAVAVKHLAVKGAKSVAFIGTGVIAESMARSTATVFGFEEAFAYSRDVSKAQTFCDKMSEELGYPFAACGSAEDAVRAADVVFTQTPGGEWVLEESWLRPHALIVCSGSDQPTKNEIPPNVLKKAKVVTDITAQCARVGEVRSAIAAGVMTAEDVHAELGQIVSGKVKGRKGKELIVCDLTGTGAQDAAIGSYVMDVLD